jgi:hypothetical protein
LFLTSAVVACLAVSPTPADALAKLKPEKLEAVRQAVQALRSQWREVPRPGPYTEYRANLHVHSALSHDSRGTIEEIVAAARAVGTRIVMLTEHPSERHDFFTDGHRGKRGGVLLIPGAETNGFLAFPTHSLRGLATDSPQEFADLVRRRGGLTFLSHLEERMDWEVRGLTGVEIYNTHADFKDEKALIAALRNPLWVLRSIELFRKYPQESFSALQDYPAEYLKRWDVLCEKAPHTGVAANDAHQNVGLVARLDDGGKVVVEDALGKRLLQVEAAAVPAFKAASAGKKAGEVILQARLDPYEVSLRHVGTHLLLTEFSEKGVWEALQAGRAFVAFDWLADSRGFDLAAVAGPRRYEMGSRLTYEKDLKIHGRAPLAGQWKVLRNGAVVAEARGRELDISVPGPGNYRAEVRLDIAGEDMIWVLTNPLYIRPAGGG